MIFTSLFIGTIAQIDIIACDWLELFRYQGRRQQRVVISKGRCLCRGSHILSENLERIFLGNLVSIFPAGNLTQEEASREVRTHGDYYRTEMYTWVHYRTETYRRDHQRATCAPRFRISKCVISCFFGPLVVCFDMYFSNSQLSLSLACLIDLYNINIQMGRCPCYVTVQMAISGNIL